MRVSEKFERVLVDCTRSGSHKALMKHYGVRGYPTVLILDPRGRVLGRLGSRQPAQVVQQFDRLLLMAWSRRLVAGVADLTRNSGRRQ